MQIYGPIYGFVTSYKLQIYDPVSIFYLLQANGNGIVACLNKGTNKINWWFSGEIYFIRL